jgi:hypothetical protein
MSQIVSTADLHGEGLKMIGDLDRATRASVSGVPSIDYQMGFEASKKLTNIVTPTVDALKYGYSNTDLKVTSWVNNEEHTFKNDQNIQNDVNAYLKFASKLEGKMSDFPASYSSQKVKNSLSSLLSNYSSPKILDEFANARPGMFSTDEITYIKKSMDTDDNTKKIYFTPEQEKILKNVREKHAVGKIAFETEAESQFVAFSVEDFVNEQFLRKYPLSKQSPEGIAQLWDENSDDFAAHSGLVNNIIAKFKMDFADDASGSAMARDIPTSYNLGVGMRPLSEVALDSKGDILNINQLEKEFKGKLDLNGYMRTSVFPGTQFLKNPLTGEDTKNLTAFFTSKTVDKKSKFDLAQMFAQNIEEYNKGLADKRASIDAFGFLEDVTQNGMLARHAYLSLTSPSLAWKTYVSMNDHLDKISVTDSVYNQFYDSIGKQLIAIQGSLRYSDNIHSLYKEIASADYFRGHSTLTASDFSTSTIRDFVTYEVFKDVKNVGGSTILVYAKDMTKAEKNRMTSTGVKTSLQKQLNEKKPYKVGESGERVDLDVRKEMARGEYILEPTGVELNKFLFKVAPDTEKARRGTYNQVYCADGTPFIFNAGDVR